MVCTIMAALGASSEARAAASFAEPVSPQPPPQEPPAAKEGKPTAAKASPPKPAGAAKAEGKANAAPIKPKAGAKAKAKGSPKPPRQPPSPAPSEPAPPSESSGSTASPASTAATIASSSAKTPEPKIKTKEELPEQSTPPRPNEPLGVRSIKLGNSQATAQMNNKEVNANWARFNRSLAPSTGANARSEKVPPELALNMVGIDAKKHYFRLWLENGQSWKNLEAYEHRSETDRSTDSFGEAWFTLGQLVKHYQSEAVADAIMKRKATDPKLWRPHPDAPSCPDAVQYWCWRDEGKRHELDKSRQVGVKASADLEGDAGRILMDSFQTNTCHSAAAATVAASSPTPQQGGEPSASFVAQSAALEKLRQKEEAKLLKQQEREAQKQKEKEERDALKEANKNNPVVLAKKWLFGVAALIDQAYAAASDAATCTKLPPSIATEYSKVFEAHANSLKDLRNTIESAITNHTPGEDHEHISSKLAQASGKVDAMKNDQKLFNNIKKSAYKGKRPASD